MEGIVVGIAQINFHSANEDSTRNVTENSGTQMSASANTTSEGPSVSGLGNNSVNNLGEVEFLSHSGWEEIDDDLEKNKEGFTFAERRRMPRRSKESSLLGIKHRTIEKHPKRTEKREDFQNLTPSQIKKIYLNKKLTKFKPSSLETIFEEASTPTNNEQDCNRLMGERKIKRSLSFSNGFRYSKTLLNKRRAKIKKIFGRRFALKKISLEEFITKLNNSIDKPGDELNQDSQMEDKSEIAQETSHSEVYVNYPAENIIDEKNTPPTELPFAFKSTMSL